MPTEEELLQEIEDDLRAMGLEPAPLAIEQPKLSAKGLQLSLHTAPPTQGGGYEVDYVGYARQSLEGVMREDGLGLVSAQDIAFPECASDGGAVTHLGIWKDGLLIVAGQITISVAATIGTRIVMPAGQLKVDLQTL